MPSSLLATPARRASSASRPAITSAGMAAQHLRLAGRQVELAAPDIDPHVGVGDHHVGIARQPEPDRVEQLRQALVRDLHVDVLEMDGVAEILGGAVEFFAWRASRV